MLITLLLILLIAAVANGFFLMSIMKKANEVPEKKDDIGLKLLLEQINELNRTVDGKMSDLSKTMDYKISESGKNMSETVRTTIFRIGKTHQRCYSGIDKAR